MLIHNVADDHRNIGESYCSIQKSLHRLFVRCVQHCWHGTPRISGIVGQLEGGELFPIRALKRQRSHLSEIQWGLIPDMTGTQTLRHLVRQDVARELTYTGRIVSGTEAVEIGLATHVSDTPYEAALELAQEIASKSPDAVRAAKQLLTAAPVVSTEEGLLLEEKLQKTLIGGRNQVEAVQANLQKRDPQFADPE